MSLHPEIQTAIGRWSAQLESVPGWKDWNRGKIRRTILDVDRPDGEADREFVFPEPISGQHLAIMSYLELHTTIEALSDLQYYFRRYPFAGLPMTRSAHFRYICELYFSRFYEFRERLKKCLNAVNDTVPTPIFQVGVTILAFNKQFDQELRARNSVHHTERFDELGIDRLMWFELRSLHPEVGKGWALESKSEYRRMAREWSNRVIRRTQHLEEYERGIADAMLTNCDYLKLQGD